MHIAYLFDRPLPATETDSEQALKTVAALARRDLRMSLLVPDDKRGFDAAALRRYYQVEGDFELRKLPAPLCGWEHGRKIGHALQGVRNGALRDVDVLYTRNFPALFAAPRSGLPYVYETYRPWGDQFPFLRPAFRASLGHARSLGAILHSTYAGDRYRRLGLPEHKLAVIHNGYDPTHFDPTADRHALRRQLGLPIDGPLVTYAGHINATKGLDVVLGMAKRCPHVRFVLVGSQGDGLVERLARQHRNVHLVPWQRFDATARHLLASDVLLQPPSGVPLRVVGNTVLPMKLFLYLAAGRPILAPDSPDMAELLEDDRNAVLVPPGRTDAAAAALHALLHDSERMRRLGEAARASAESLTWDARATKIQAFLERRLAEVR